MTGSITVDGVAVADELLVHERSVLFAALLPDEEIFAAPVRVVWPVLDEGTYALLPPLPRGRHELHIQGQFPDGCFGGTTVDVTYALRVR